MDMRWFSKGKLKYFFVNIVEPLAAWAFAFCSFLPQASKLFINTETGWRLDGEWWQLLITCIWIATAIVVFGFQFYFFIKQKRWAVTTLQNELYSAAMKAQEKSNEAKMKSILQITYGNVPEWNPRNYERNVLLYDGHEHLRRILLDMRDALRDVLSTEERQVDADAVSVDLVYCYPCKEFDGLLPALSPDARNTNSSEPERNANDDVEGWRVITSGNSSIMGTRGAEKTDIHTFLSNPTSFYGSLAKKGYEFRNSKYISYEKSNNQKNIDESNKANDSKNESVGFILSLKDKEYDNVGSIVGQMLSIRNDQPTVVLLNAILTITTYGVKLCADDKGIKEEEYKEIFRSSFINPYKFMLESELAQLYIRHKIREQEMCKRTGIAYISDTASPKKRKCMLQDKCDYRTDELCPIKKHHESHSDGKSQAKESLCIEPTN